MLHLKRHWWKYNFGHAYSRIFGQFTKKRTQEEVSFIMKALSLNINSKILDIPCGHGRHCIEFARRGFNVTGVDYSHILLQFAKETTKENNTSATFIEDDMRIFTLPGRFDAIVMLGNSFGYFTDHENEKVIENISISLSKDGLFFLDLCNTIHMLPKEKDNDDVTIWRDINRQRVQIKEKSSFDPLHLIKILHWEIKTGEKIQYISARLRLYSFPEINNLFEKHHLSVVKTYGSFFGEPYSLTSPRLIAIGKKVGRPSDARTGHCFHGFNRTFHRTACAL